MTMLTGAMLLPTSHALAQQSPPAGLPLAQELAVVRSGGAALLEQPGGDVLARLATGDSVTATAQSADGEWFAVTTVRNGAGWAAAEQILLFNIDRLPVLDVDVQAAISDAATPASVAETATESSTGAEMAADSAIAPDAVGEAISPAEEEAASAANAVVTPAPSTPAAVTAAAAAGRPVVTVTLDDARLNIRSGPTTRYPVIGKALPGARYVALAQDATGDWLQIELADAPATIAWVAADYVTGLTVETQLELSERVGDLPPEFTDVISAQAEQSGTATPADDAIMAVNPPITGLTGNLVFQSGGNGSIYRYNLDSGALSTLTGGFDPAVSPDGSQVAFVRHDDSSRLLLMDIAGGNERVIYQTSDWIGTPTWSADGQSVIFSQGNGSYACYGLGLGLCFQNREICPGFDCLPSEAIVNKPEFELARIDVDGENYRNVAALNTARSPDTGPDGIVYSASTGLEITRDAPAGETWRLLRAQNAYDPAWQPNGSRIVYNSSENDHWEIFAVNADGSDWQVLTRPETALVDQLPSNVSPAWSPDGQHIVYLSNLQSEGEAGAWRLWVMDADGSNKRLLPVDVPLEFNFAQEQMVSWGP